MLKDARPVTAVVVGAGPRGRCYAEYAKHRPDQLQIVGVADRIPLRRKKVAERHGFSEARCFETAEAFAAVPKFADAVINGTMDHQHVATSLPLLEAGYDILLEKPIATNRDDLLALGRTARRLDRKIMVGHVLRYAPFYVAIRQRVAAGEIGDIVSVQTTEHVSYHHMVVGFVRGKWRSKKLCHSSMLMAKCCHDMDLITWMKSGVRPLAVASAGCNMQFRQEKAPKGAGTRCLVDCPIEPDCRYSARKHYLDHPERWRQYVWADIEHTESPTFEDKEAYLKGDTPYGRCVWKLDNEVVDHQAVVITFEDGCVATHNMVGGTSRPCRTIHLVGTIGEIQGDLEESRFVVRHIDPRPGHEYAEEVVDLNVEGDMHGAFGGHAGGDLRLVEDFVHFVRGEPRSISCTSIEDSVNGHLIGFCADKAMEEKCVVDIPTR
ncbi:MAG: Gfo/Idh/MocA family oxidoreductase [Planctomycetota bacterium]